MATAKKKAMVKPAQTGVDPALAKMSFGQLADKLLTLRDKRKVLEEHADELKQEEARIKEHLIRTMPKAELRKLSGRIAAVTLRETIMPHVKDWELFRKYVKRKGAFELMQKRTSPEAFRERWEAGEEIPGVEKFKVLDLSVRKSA